jgi:hypothetical protein
MLAAERTRAAKSSEPDFQIELAQSPKSGHRASPDAPSGQVQQPISIASHRITRRHDSKRWRTT